MTFGIRAVGRTTLYTMMPTINDTQHKNKNTTFSTTIITMTTLSVMKLDAQCHVFIVMPSVIILNDIILNVVAPYSQQNDILHNDTQQNDFKHKDTEKKYEGMTWEQ